MPPSVGPSPDPAPLWSRSVQPSTIRKVLAATFLLAVIPIATYLQADSGYGVLQPGPVVRLTDSVTGPDLAPKSPTQGWFAFTTVEVSELSYLELLEDRLSGHGAVKLSPSAFSYEARAQMIESKETASVLALGLTRNLVLESSGALVLSVLPDSPASRAGIESGDVIFAYAGRTVSGPDSLRAALAGSGESELKVYRKKEAVALSVRPERGRLGVLVGSSYGDALADVLAIDTGKVGGPSAGLLMTLAAIDALSPGDLTAGHRIAGTGTIDQSGRVGPISGISFKASAAARAGAEWFFLPESLLPEVPDTLDLELYPVRSLDEALSVLCAAGATDEVCLLLEDKSA